MAHRGMPKRYDTPKLVEYVQGEGKLVIYAVFLIIDIW